MIVKVARTLGQNLQAAATLAPATTQRMMASATAQLSTAADPVETLQLAAGADPALDPLLVSQRTAAPGTPVNVTVVVRNVGRGVATGVTVALYAGEQVAGYRIYRSATATGTFEFIGEAADPVYVDLLSQVEKATCYRVSAYTSSNIMSAQSVPRCHQSENGLSDYSVFLPMVRR